MFGAGLVVTAASINTILQTLADEDKRARVISMYVMCFIGVAPLGNFTAGALAESIGAHRTLALFGLCAALAGCVFAAGFRTWAASVRPVYIDRGIIEEPKR